MPETNDHDILIEVRTTLNILLQTQKDYIALHRELAERVSSLEIYRGSDSERLNQIQVVIQQVTENKTKLAGHEAELGNVKGEVLDLRKKSQILDVINAAGAIVAGIIGYLFGPR